MKRRVLLAAVALAGAVGGGAAAQAVQGTPAPATAPGPRAPVVPATLPEARAGVYLLWTPETLPASLVSGAAELPGVEGATVVRGGDLDMVASWSAAGTALDAADPGWAYPLDAIGIEPATYAAFVPASVRAVMADLTPGQAVLGSTSARLRRMGPSGTLELAGGERLVVTGVVDDALVGGAEVVLHAEDAARHGWPHRYALVSSGARMPLEEAARALVPKATALRIRAPGETPFLRHGDAVLPQALIKARFGEFAYRRVAGRDVEQDAAWQGANLVTTQLPVLGTARCHRAVLPALEGALTELEERNLSGLLDRGGFAGCWAPRAIEPGAPLSRHAWGVAIDVNVTKNPTGVGSAQDPRLVEVMRRWGFTSGSQWLVPDPAHFEYLRPPAAEAGVP